MRVTFSPTLVPSMRGTEQQQKKKKFSTSLSQFEITKKAKVPCLELMKGINPNNNNVFDTFQKIDDVTRKINFVKSQEAWDECLESEILEFKSARSEYQEDKTQKNYDHMEEEMGDILYTVASIAKEAGIDPKEAFKSTNRKFYNRVNLMERYALTSGTDTPDNLKDCNDQQRRTFWERAKRKLYEAQALTYTTKEKTNI